MRSTEKAVTKPYEPTPQERTAIEAYLTQKREKAPAPRMRVSETGGVAQVSPDHPESAFGATLLMAALGTTDLDFLNGLLGQIANAGSRGSEVDENGLNFLLAVVKGIEPEDEVESMLAAQMAAVHMATMTFARRLAQVENIQQQDSAEHAFNKLARTFTTQIEALKRYRTGGQQRMVVEHVTVNEGGQAIVGSVSHGGVGVQKKTKPTP